MLTNITIFKRQIQVESDKYFNLSSISEQTESTILYMPLFEVFLLIFCGFFIFNKHHSPYPLALLPEGEAYAHNAIVITLFTASIFEIERSIIHSLNFKFFSDDYSSQTALGGIAQFIIDNNNLLLDYLTSP